MLHPPAPSRNLQGTWVPSSASVSPSLLLRFMVVMVTPPPPGPAPSSLYVAVTVSFLMKSEVLRYFRPLPMVIRSSMFSGSLPCLSQQLWQSGQWHLQRTYLSTEPMCGMWKVTSPTFRTRSETSLILPSMRSERIGSMSQSFCKRSRDSRISFCDNRYSVIT